MLAFMAFTVLGATTIYAGWFCYNTVNFGCGNVLWSIHDSLEGGLLSLEV